MRRTVAFLALALAASLLVACGSGSPSVSDDAAADLQAHVAAVRSAVGARDVPGAERALDTLRASVARLRRSGDLASGRAAEILAAAHGVEARLVSITTTTTTTTTTVPATLPPPAGDDHGKGKGNGDDDGKGKGGGKGEG